MAKYLVTGGAGFIGSNIVEELVRRGESVRVLDDFSTGRRENLESINGSEFVEGSITDMNTCEAVCDGIDYVLHQAALPSVPRSLKDPVRSNIVNVTGTVNMLWAAHNAGVKRFIFATSSSVYGNTPILPKIETMTTIPLSPYAVSKLTGEHYCRVFYKCFGLETVSLRYFNVYGPRQDPNSQYGAVIPVFCKSLLAGEKPHIYGDGGQTRDFTYVADAVQANLNACTAPSACAGKVFNIAAGGRTSVIDLLHQIRALLSADDIEPIFSDVRQGDVRDSFADITLAKELIGYEPKYDTRRGLAEAIEYYKRVCR